MTSLTELFIGNAGATVEVLDDRTFDTSGTWVKPTGITFAPTDIALIELWGGGGGGGRKDVGYASLGGFGGSYLRFTRLVSSLGASEPVAVGAGGVGGSSGSVNGGWGGDTTFAGVTANGGLGGLPNGEIAWAQIVGVLTLSPRVYGAGSGGHIMHGGQYPPGRSVHGGTGGEPQKSSSVPATAGQVPGGGGGASNSTNNNGGAGASGRVRIRIMRGLNQFEISEGPL